MKAQIIGERTIYEDGTVDFVNEGRTVHEKEAIGLRKVIHKTLKMDDDKLEVEVSSYILKDYCTIGRQRGSKGDKPVKFKNKVFKKEIPFILKIKEVFEQFIVTKVNFPAPGTYGVAVVEDCSEKRNE